MRAVMVVVLPEIPEDEEGDPMAVQLSAVAKALNIPEMKNGRMIVTINETAEAVLRATHT